MEHEEVLRRLGGAKKFGEKAGLDKPRRLMELLGNPQDELRFIHIAGTNGKGSTAAFLSEVLTRCGYRTGLFTSPFLSVFNERFRYNGEMISDTELRTLMERVKKAAEQMAKEGTGYPTEFDMVTATAFCWFYEKRCELVVLEVGLGGRFDATNVISTALVSVITKLSLDHTQYLGNTLAQIAFEKCGIMKENGTVVCSYEQEEEALCVIKETARARNNRLILCERPEPSDCILAADGNQFLWRGKPYRTSLLGEYQIANAVLALTVLETLKEQGYRIEEHHIQKGIENTTWSGRMEVLSHEPLVVADGSHNPDGMRAFVRSARQLAKGKKTVCVVAMMRDKDCASVLSLLSGFPDVVVLTKVENPRSMTAKELYDIAKPWFSECYFEEDPFLAIERAKELAEKDGAVFSVGSLYFIDTVKKAMKKGAA